MKPLVLCLGNDVLSDDAFGFRVGEALTGSSVSKQADITTAALAGFALLDLLQGRNSVLIVDTVMTGATVPGKLHFFPRGHWTPSRGLAFSHQISLPTALQLGQLLGYEMPRTIDVLAVEAADVSTLSEDMTPEIRAAVPKAIDLITRWVEGQTKEANDGYREHQEALA